VPLQNKENKQDVLSAASVSVNRRTSQKWTETQCLSHRHERYIYRKTIQCCISLFY